MIALQTAGKLRMKMAVDIMKKLHMTIALAIVLAIVVGILVLFIPTAASATTADDEVTIRVMEMHEKSTSAVMNRIQLPEAASEKVSEEATYRNRLTEHKGDGNGTAEMDRERTQAEDQERLLEMDQDHEMDMINDQIRDTEHEIDREQETSHRQGAK